MIPFSVMKNRTSAVTYLGTFIHGFILWCLLYYAPFYFEAVKGYSPLLSGVALFPQTFTVAPAAMIVGVVSAITGRYRWATWIGWTLTVFGMGLLNYQNVNTSVPAWIFLSIVGGLGTGCLFPALGLAVQAASNNSNMSHAVILFAFFRAFGQAVGVAIGGVVFQNAFKHKLMSYPDLAARAVEYSVDSSSLVEIIKSLPAGTQKTELLDSYMSGLHAIYIMCTAFAAVAWIASFWTEGLPLDRELTTDQGFQHKKKKGDSEEAKKSEDTVE